MKITKPYHVITPEKPVVLGSGLPIDTVAIGLDGSWWTNWSYRWSEFNTTDEQPSTQRTVNAVQVLIPLDSSALYKSGEKGLPVIGVIEVQE